METRKCIIDPNGDAIICLRNFDPPFAVLGTDEELFVLKKMKSLFGTASSGTTAPSGPGGFAGFGSGGLFGNAPSGTTAPSGSTAPPGSFGGMFGNAPSGSTAPSGFAGMFGNAPSSTTIPPSSFAGMFGNAPSGSPAPSGSDAFAGFGSGGFFGSASSPDSAGAAGAAPSGSTSTAFSFGNIPGTQTQSPSDGIEKESSRVAPQGPSENAVKPEEQTEPSTATPELHLQVSSAHLKLASRYFQKAFDGDFQESKRDVDGFLCVDASDWNREALIIVLRIIHGQNRQVPKVLDLEMLAKVAIIVDYYDCHELFDAFAELWLLRLKHRFILLHKLDRELILLLLVSWVFRWESEFKLATKIVLRQSKGPLNTLKLPIPEEITCKFSAIYTTLKTANTWSNSCPRYPETAGSP
ncbi:hypothetical protein E0Z10_g1629 [Xylaria hypoxylon]|uniref:BTB domain-containing protein n=1 Tax=Xylaria hypoxylon TaxID=37992 RepID=A0A4Z0YS26_9PEZI|nr:hypothetical protein E0Z10_g1629 [Xylaria hypoxylon]